MNKFRPSVEMLEHRDMPGSLIPWQPDTSGLMIVAAAAQVHRLGDDDAQPMPVALAERRVDIDLPPADAVIISKEKDGRTDPFLNRAHDVFPVGTPQDATSIKGVIDDITTEFNRNGKPVDIILVAGDDGNSFIVGKSYLFKGGADARQLEQDCNGMIGNLTIVGSNGQQKKDLLQELANGLDDGNHPVRITAYVGAVKVVGATPPDLGHFTRPVGPALRFVPR
jgi:hypothetical protein